MIQALRKAIQRMPYPLEVMLTCVPDGCAANIDLDTWCDGIRLSRGSALERLTRRNYRDQHDAFGASNPQFTSLTLPAPLEQLVRVCHAPATAWLPKRQARSPQSPTDA